MPGIINFMDAIYNCRIIKVTGDPVSVKVSINAAVQQQFWQVFQANEELIDTLTIDNPEAGVLRYEGFKRMTGEPNQPIITFFK